MDQVYAADNQNPISDLQVAYDNLLQYNKQLESQKEQLKMVLANLQQTINTKDELLQNQTQLDQRLQQETEKAKKFETIINEKDNQIRQLKIHDCEAQKRIEQTVKEKDNEIKEKNNEIARLKSTLNETEKELWSLLLIKNHCEQLSNQIKDQLNSIIDKQEILKNIRRIAINLNQTIQNNSLVVELNNILLQDEKKMEENYFNKHFKCCDGRYEIVHCKLMKCMYHINCLYPKLIRQGQLAINNCDCGQPFPIQILRKVNFVEAKCLMDQILENQLSKLLSLMKKDQKFLFYKCPNLFCNFQWCFRQTNSNLKNGCLSYCPNCQMNVQSEIIQS